MKVYVENKDKMTSYQWGYDGERYSVTINFDLPSDTKVNVLSLANYTKQVRREVLQEIREEVKKLIEKDFKLCNHEYANGYCYGLQYDLAKILDQIQGEIKWKNAN